MTALLTISTFGTKAAGHAKGLCGVSGQAFFSISASYKLRKNLQVIDYNIVCG
jgi:hypothetical protein